VSYSKGDVVLFPYPFSDLHTKKVRPAVIVSQTGDKYNDVFIVPLTSKVDNLGEGEFVLNDWQNAGLNVPTAVKRGCALIDISLILKKAGSIKQEDVRKIRISLQAWLGIND